eukprot:SAG31_NODE_46179_length_255_cov_1.134615_1_plen_21_part_01
MSTIAMESACSFVVMFSNIGE